MAVDSISADSTVARTNWPLMARISSIFLFELHLAAGGGGGGGGRCGRKITGTRPLAGAVRRRGHPAPRNPLGSPTSAAT